VAVPTAAPLAVSDYERRALVKMTRSTCSPHRVVVQAKALLWAAAGEANEEIARRSDVDADTVRRWRRRFEERGVEGVGVIAKGRGRKPWLPGDTVAEVVRVTLEETPPDTSLHWTTRSLARRMGVGKDTVARIWRDHEIKPWKVGTARFSNDPCIEDKLVDVVGLYLDPPTKLAVFSFDEAAEIHVSGTARDRTRAGSDEGP
jgi:transposase